MTTTQEQVQAYRVMPIADLRPSPTNPRRRRDATKDRELEASVREVGVLQPVLVRPLAGGTFELVCGRRRFDAAKRVGLATLPAVVREMDDALAAEVQAIENVQREDVHPLDEAAGYEQLVTKAGLAVEAIATKVGKSTSYIYQRLKLLELAAPAQAAFLDGRITAGHAVQLARIPAAKQSEALNWIGVGRRDGSVSSVRELGAWIEREVHLDLRRAPFDPKDATLVAKAGACTTCPKRTGAQPALWPEIARKDTCTDPACFAGKVAAQLAQRLAGVAPDVRRVDLRQSWEVARGGTRVAGALDREAFQRVGRDACPHVEPAIVVASGTVSEVGTRLHICATKTCPVHWRRGTAKPSAQEQARTATARRAAVIDKAVAVRVWAAVGTQAARRLRGRLPKPVATVLRQLAGHVARHRLPHDGQVFLATVRGLAPTVRKEHGTTTRDYLGPLERDLAAQDDRGLLGFLAQLATVPAWGHPQDDEIAAVSKAYGIPLAPIRAAVQKAHPAPRKAAAKGRTAKASGKVQTRAPRVPIAKGAR